MNRYIDPAPQEARPIKTRGNFLVMGSAGERIAAFAVEDDAKAFIAMNTMLNAMEALRQCASGELERPITERTAWKNGGCRKIQAALDELLALGVLPLKEV